MVCPSKVPAASRVIGGPSGTAFVLIGSSLFEGCLGRAANVAPAATRRGRARPCHCPGPRSGWSLPEGRCSFDQGEDGLALLDDVGGELGGVAAADVADRVDRSGRVNRTSPAVTVVGGWPSI